MITDPFIAIVYSILRIEELGQHPDWFPAFGTRLIIIDVSVFHDTRYIGNRGDEFVNNGYGGGL